MKRTHNDTEREEWVINSSEDLYHAQLRSRKSMRAFIRENRTRIDEYIDAVLDTEPGESWQTKTY